MTTHQTIKILNKFVETNPDICDFLNYEKLYAGVAFPVDYKGSAEIQIINAKKWLDLILDIRENLENLIETYNSRIERFEKNKEENR